MAFSSGVAARAAMPLPSSRPGLLRSLVDLARIGILQRYVLRETIGPILLSLLALTFFLLIRFIYEMTRMAMASGTANFILELLLYSLPSILVLTVPIAILLGTLLGVGRLAVENEIRACQTAGVNLLRIFWPLILLCALTGAAMVVLNYEYVPRLYRQGNELKSRLASAALNSIPAGVPNDDFEDIVGQAKVIFYFRERDLATKDMLQVRMMIERPQGGLGAKQASDSGNPVHEVLMASRGRIETDEQSGLMRIVLFDGAVHSMGEDIDKNDIRAELEARFGGRTDDKAYWEAKRAWAAPPKAPNERSIRFDVWTQTVRFRDAAAIERRPEELTARELLTAAEMGREWPEWKNLKADEGDIRDRINKCLTEFSIRTAFPIACLAFAMMAIPLAIFIRPTGKSIGVAVAFGLVMAYYWMIQWGESIAKSGDRMGHAIIFMPNVLMICLGAYLLRRAVRQ